MCVVDICSQGKFLSRDWARVQPTCYVTVNPRLAARFLQEEWICRVRLADIVSGEVDVAGIVAEIAETGPPATVQNASVAVCAAGPRPVVETALAARPPERCFIVQVTEDTILIEGEAVMSRMPIPAFWSSACCGSGLWRILATADRPSDSGR